MPFTDPAAKQRLINALRGGKFHQADGVLFDSEGGGHCCLGVQCEINARSRDGWIGMVSNVARAGQDQFDEYDSGKFFEDAVRDDLEVTAIPEDFRFGLTEIELEMLAALNDGNSLTRTGKEQPHPLFKQDPGDNSWIFNKDGLKHSFDRIADFIEVHL